MLSSLLLALALGQLQPLPPNLIPLDSDEGRAMLVRAKESRAFYPLVSQFVTQDTTSFCGVASSVMVLNAMPIEAPVAQPWAPFRLFTQENVFGDGELKAASVRKGGLTLDQTAYLLGENHVQAVAVHASDSSEAEFRQRARESLAADHHHVLVDFLRSELHQDTGAHWSPLGAYDAQSDRFLVLDVARFRYPPYWATTADLFAAMKTLDLDSGKTRGYVLVSPQAGAAPRAAVPPIGHKLYAIAGGLGTVCFALGALVGGLVMRRRRR
jgi:hypothetical protein